MAIDGKNISRMLLLTLQIMEAGFPVILVVNLWIKFWIWSCDSYTAFGRGIRDCCTTNSGNYRNWLILCKEAIGQYQRPKKKLVMKFSDILEQGIGGN